MGKWSINVLCVVIKKWSECHWSMKKREITAGIWCAPLRINRVLIEVGKAIIWNGTQVRKWNTWNKEQSNMMEQKGSGWNWGWKAGEASLGRVWKAMPVWTLSDNREAVKVFECKIVMILLFLYLRLVLKFCSKDFCFYLSVPYHILWRNFHCFLLAELKQNKTNAH